MVETLDQSVGRILQALQDLRLDSNTIVLLTSDNGGLSTSEGSPTSNLPLRGGKGWLYEGGIREPYLIKWPGKTPAGSVCNVPVISTDFYPTILEMAGLPQALQQHLDGLSLVPLLTQMGTIARKDLFWHYPHYSNQGGFPGGAIRSGDYKLIERFENGDVQLYNLQADVGERVNLAKHKPSLTESMQKKLHNWYRKVNAKFLQARPNGPLPWRP